MWVERGRSEKQDALFFGDLLSLSDPTAPKKRLKLILSASSKKLGKSLSSVW